MAWPTLPNWPPRDWRAYTALIASWLGASLLTVILIVMTLNFDGYADRLIDALTKAVGERAPAAAPELDALATVLGKVVQAQTWTALGTLFIIGVVLIGLGMAINRRSFSANLGKLASVNSSGGDDEDAAPPPKVRTITETEVIPGGSSQTGEGEAP
jgi:hypothetical protein